MSVYAQVCSQDLQVTREIFPVLLTKGRLINIYYIFIAILMLFLVIFEDDKSDNFLRGDESFRALKRTKSRQKQNK